MVLNPIKQQITQRQCAPAHDHGELQTQERLAEYCCKLTARIIAEMSFSALQCGSKVTIVLKTHTFNIINIYSRIYTRIYVLIDRSTLHKCKEILGYNYIIIKISCMLLMCFIPHRFIIFVAILNI